MSIESYVFLSLKKGASKAMLANLPGDERALREARGWAHTATSIDDHASSS